MGYAIETHRLTKYYGKHKVVDSLDLKVPEGSVVGFLGPNGAGKSTTIKMLLGMVQPAYGCIQIFGQDLSTLPPSFRQRVAYLAEGHPLYPWMKIEQIVEFTRSFYERWNQRLLDEILDHFDLRRDARIRSLSKGQKAQVSLALAVAPDPELLIMDDPMLGLDTLVRRDFLESMIHIIQKKGRTIFFSSHILGDVERVADRICVLENGVLRVDCPTDQFKQSLRKVILTFSGEPPAVPACAGLVGARVVEKTLELIIANYNGRHKAFIDALAPDSVQELEMNLEDAFIEYTRGSRKSLPFFHKEESDDTATG